MCVKIISTCNFAINKSVNILHMIVTCYSGWMAYAGEKAI